MTSDSSASCWRGWTRCRECRMRAAWAERRGWLIGIGVALAIALLLVIGRNWLSERIVPDPRMTRRIEQAEHALQAGRLSAADGSGARELFESVLAQDP